MGLIVLLAFFAQGCASFGIASDEIEIPIKFVNPCKQEQAPGNLSNRLTYPISPKTQIYWNSLRDSFGDLVYRFMALRDVQDYDENPVKNITIDDAKAIEINVSPNAIRQVLTWFPAAWRAAIYSISFINKRMEIPQRDYGLPLIEGRIQELSLLACYPDNYGKSDIYIYKMPKDYWTEKSIQAGIVHEVAHLNDWRSPRRSIEERIMMGFEVVERVKSRDRFRFYYVENIGRGVRLDPHQKLKQQAQEYWAELVKHYFLDKQQLPKKDKELVEKYLH